MNTIYNMKHVFGVWLVEVHAPDGTPMLINHKGTEEEAWEKAMRAEPEFA